MDNIDYIYASNGSGEVPRMTVTGARAPGATTLNVDSLVNVPPKFIATSGTLDSETGLIDPETVLIFKGQIVDTHIEIVEIAPGYADTNGNAVGQVVVLKPSTEWADMVATSLDDVRTSLGGATPLEFVVSDTQPAPVTGKTIVWLQPLS